jgi:hypothetical protein
MIVTFVASLWHSSVMAHEGHDHGAPPPPVSTTIAPRVDVSSVDFELVAIARGATIRIYLDEFRSNAPLRDAIVEIDGPHGTAQAVPVGDGVYTLDAPWLLQGGQYDLAFTVQANGTIDILTATLTVPARKDPRETRTGFWSWIAHAAADEHGRNGFPSGNTGLWIVAAGSFLLGLIVATFVHRGRAASAILLFGFASGLLSFDAHAASPSAPPAERDVAQRFADGALFVPKTTQRILGIRTLFTQIGTYAGTVELPGRVIPDPTTTGYVQASVSGRLIPPNGGFPRLGTSVRAGDVLAFVQPAIGAADVTTQQQQARELDQQIAIVERRLERFQQIQGVVARAQIEDAQLELQGLRTRRANLEKAPREPEPLVAPVSGVIAAVQAIAGQIAEPNAIVFQIIDPTRFWVEALSFESLPFQATAQGRFGDRRTVPLAYRGSGLADRNQAIPVQFSIESAERGLRAGQLLTVFAATQDERSGIAVPRTSVLRGPNGQAIVYEHTNAERFVPREVRVEPLDGSHVLVVSGLEAGRRIVTQGAELLNQIR